MWEPPELVTSVGGELAVCRLRQILEVIEVQGHLVGTWKEPACTKVRTKESRNHNGYPAAGSSEWSLAGAARCENEPPFRGPLCPFASSTAGDKSVRTWGTSAVGWPETIGIRVTDKSLRMAAEQCSAREVGRQCHDTGKQESICVPGFRSVAQIPMRARSPVPEPSIITFLTQLFLGRC